MRRRLLWFVFGVLAASAVTAQLVITSFNQNGELTWTNSVSNATYRVEWANSATGAWNKFDVLTNLRLLSATNNTVAVKVPTFYRVIWRDAPAHAGKWNYTEFNTNGNVTQTGQFTLSADTNPITGTWNFSGGSGVVRGIITNAFLGLDLFPGVVDSRYVLWGRQMGNTYTGQWTIGNFAGQYFSGPFSAEKDSIDP
jgi:hypothetical protein